MLGKKLINAGPVSSGANTFASENFNTVLYTGNGSTQRIGGYINRGAIFNGSSSKITLPNSTEGIGEVDSSFSFWVYPVSVSSGYELVALLTNNDWVEIRYNSSGQFVIYPARQSNDTYVSLTAVTKAANNWYNIVITRDSATSTIKLYIDGSLVETNTSWDGTLTSAASSPNGLGANVSSNTLHFSGKLDQVRFFNKALSSSEVTTLYGETHASNTISTTDIFSDNSGVALYQLDGNANDTGGVSGKFGAGAIFNGSNADIDLPSGMQSSTMTVSLWMYLNATETGSIVYEFSNGYGMHFLNTGTAGKIASQYANSNSSHVQSNSVISSGQWVHIVGVHTSSSSKLYVDGVQQSGAALTDFYTCDQNTIGSRRSGEFFEGRLDDIRIYSDELTSTEVGYIYNNTTASIPTDNLVAYYKLDGDARDEQQLYDGTASNVKYAYDGTATNVTYQEATSFQPDLVWIKARSIVSSHNIFDSIRGNKRILTNATNAEVDLSPYAPDGLTSFNSNGFTVGDNYNGDYGLNGDPSGTYGSSQGYVAWCFKGGGTAVSNTDGSITSSVSANQDAGFSICSYTATNSTQNVGHGLSATPELVIIKRTSSPDYDWIVYTNVIDSSVDYLILNSTAIKADTTKTLNSTVFTTPSTGDFVAYSFHSVDGYSKIGSYTGTGASGNMVETGFEPAFILIKGSSGTGRNWVIKDNKRDTTNPNSANLYPNLSNAENTVTSLDINFLSNGFSLEGTSGDVNANTETYIYLAIAADPDTTTPTVEDSFDVVTYTGNGSSQDIETDFKPDLVWVKNRTGTAYDHKIADSVRGATKIIESSTTDAEITATGSINAFNTNGFTIGTDNSVNGNGNNFVAWCWKAGDHDDNLPQINTEGSIDSVVSVNAEAGFSIVKYTGEGATRTIGHGLSSAPEMMIIKNLDQPDGWAVYTSTTGSGQFMQLNESFAAGGAGDIFGTPNDVGVSPTSTVFTIGSNHKSGANGEDYIAYCFHSVTGYQKIGSYTGNASSNSITTGFQPRFVMLKRTNTTGNWNIWDAIRNTSADNDNNNILYPNKSDSETDAGAGRYISFDSNGFTISGDSGDQNANGSTYIYLAIK